MKVIKISSKNIKNKRYYQHHVTFRGPFQIEIGNDVVKQGFLDDNGQIAIMITGHKENIIQNNVSKGVLVDSLDINELLLGTQWQELALNIYIQNVFTLSTEEFEVENGQLKYDDYGFLIPVKDVNYIAFKETTENFDILNALRSKSKEIIIENEKYMIIWQIKD